MTPLGPPNPDIGDSLIRGDSLRRRFGPTYSDDEDAGTAMS